MTGVMNELRGVGNKSCLGGTVKGGDRKREVEE